jgi:solute carrier family 6 GABA transporter-like protein 6/8/11/12/13
LSKNPDPHFDSSKKVLQIGDGIEDFDSLRWELVACLICAWVLVYFAIWKSIKSSAKVRYFTATLPFVLIIVFLAKSLTLEGADKGMQYFFKPKFHLLLEAKVELSPSRVERNKIKFCRFGSTLPLRLLTRWG